METIQVTRCVHCMADLTNEGGGSFCTKCGKPIQQVDQPAYCLRPFSILRGKYLVGKMLGQGGFGITYIGLDMNLESKVAIKECYPGSMVTRNCSVSNQLEWSTGMNQGDLWRSSCESFLREARKMAKMQDIPAVVRVRDTFEENNTAYIVMDFVEGITLKQWLEQNGTLTPSQCVELLRPMISALESVHRQGFIHRDISPDNIMLQSDGGLKLLDLGAAKDMERGGGAHSQLVTKNGFSPVEQYAETGEIGPWTDVYALCATMYYCMTGKPVTPALDRIDGPKNLTFDPKDFREPLPAAVASALQDGLALNHRERIQSTTELLARLDGVQPPKPKPNPNPKPKPVAKIAAACAAALLLITSGALLFRHFNQTADDPDTSNNPEETDVIGVDEPEGLHIVELGTSNPNMLNFGGYVEIPREYLYYIGGDNALYLCVYNTEDSTFYMGDASKLHDKAGYITLGNDCVYFEATVSGAESLFRMNRDGSNIQSIFSAVEGRNLIDLQYAGFSDGREYLYFAYQNEPDGLYSLYRYDLSSNGVEAMVESDLFWYNLYGDSIYYTELVDGSSRLVRTDLDGQNEVELNNDAVLTVGFVVDDTVFLWSYRDEALLVYDLEGTQKTDISGFYDIDLDMDSFDFSYGEGWLYYGAADGNIHRIRANGTGDTVAIEGHSPEWMCVDQDSWVWFIESLPTDREHLYRQQAFISNRDGSTLFEIGGSKSSWGLTVAYQEDLEYSQEAASENDYDGVFITGYTGELTSFELPDEIGGLPVTGIAAEAFSENGIEEIGLPESVRYIGENAFYKCTDLTFVGLPNGLEIIDEWAFYGCSDLTSVELPDGLRRIEDFAFAETILSEVRIPASVEWIGGGTFAVWARAGLTAFYVDAGNDTFRSVDGVLYAYNDNNPTLMLVSYPSGRSSSYAVPDGTYAIQGYAFAHCRQLTDLTIPETVRIIYATSLYDTGVTAIRVSSDCDLRGTWDGSVTVGYY